MDNQKSFLIEDTIIIDDFITLIRRWVKPFFPTYEINTKQTVALSQSEVFQAIKEQKIPVDEAVDLKKEIERLNKEIERLEYRSERNRED